MPKIFSLKLQELLVILYLASLMMPSLGIKISSIGTLKVSMIISYFIIFIFHNSKVNLRNFIPILLILTAYLLTFLWSVSYSNSIIGAIGIIQLIIYSFSFLLIINHYNRSIFIKLLLSSIVIVCVFSIIYYILGIITYNGDYSENAKNLGIMIDRSMIRAKGFTDDPNIFSLYVGICLIISALNPIKKNKNFILFLLLITFLLTLSRGGIIAMIIAISATTIVKLFLSPQQEIKKVILVLLIIILAVAYIILFNDTLLNIIVKRLNNINSASGRFELWSLAFKAFHERPIFGHGIFTTKYIFEQILGKPAYTHNTFIELLLEGGSYLIFSFAAFLFYLLTQIFNKIKDNTWLFCIFLFIIIQFMTLSLSFNEFIYFLFSFILIYSSRKNLR